MTDQELNELEKRLKALERDAERYRWLTSGVARISGAVAGRMIQRDRLRALMEFHYWCTPDELDAAIDFEIYGTPIAPSEKA